jgi:hypothetical protein
VINCKKIANRKFLHICPFKPIIHKEEKMEKYYFLLVFGALWAGVFFLAHGCFLGEKHPLRCVLSIVLSVFLLTLGGYCLINPLSSAPIAPLDLLLNNGSCWLIFFVVLGMAPLIPYVKDPNAGLLLTSLIAEDGQGGIYRAISIPCVIAFVFLVIAFVGTFIMEVMKTQPK